MTSTLTSDSNTNPTAAAASGKSRYWRSLSEYRSDEAFINDHLHREFPVAASEFPEGVSRRRWMQLMGASLAMAGAAGCRYPEELIVPFVIRPSDRVPGEWYQTATNFEVAGDICHALIGCVDGRPIKVEANREHPAGGQAGSYAQASILALYDPDRARGEEGVPLRSQDGRRVESSWEAFDEFASSLVRSSGRGERFAIISPPTRSPTTIRMINRLQSQLPDARACVFNSIDGGLMTRTTEKVFGSSATPWLDLTTAKVIVALQSDFLGNAEGAMQCGGTFSTNRDPMKGDMSRLYVAEGSYTTTGTSADVRLAIRPSQIPALLAELSRRIEKLQGGQSPADSFSLENLPGEGLAYDELSAEDRLERFLNSAAADLAEAGEHGVVLVGDTLDVDTIAAGFDLNRRLGSLGPIQKVTPRADADFKNQTSLAELSNAMAGGELDTVLMLDTNLLHTAPADIDFATALSRVPHSIYLGLYDDETAAKCEWSLPMAHPLESWTDCVDVEGYYGVGQPQILPLLGGRTDGETIAAMLGESATGEQLVRRTADEVSDGGISDRQWRRLLHDGFSDDLIVKHEPLEPVFAGKLTDEKPIATLDYDDPSFKDRFEVIFTPSESLYDGRFANNGWLQELPQSITKLTWDNAAMMGPNTAKALGIKHGLMIALTRGDTTVEVPVYEIPGCAPGVVSVAIGYGRERVGMVGGMPDKDVPIVGTNIRPIRTSDAMTYASNVKARPRYTEYDLCTTQDHWAIDPLGRDEAEDRSFQLVREGTAELLKKLPEFTQAKGPHVPKVGEDGSLWSEPINEIEANEPHVPQWGMSVDLTKCLGCNACVIACQSENNIPIVGKEQVGNSREMHWLRIDRYFQGDEENADIVQEPVSCMHCETAPCEQVCPVAATVHTNEGINAMAYNRCIGTRYCANNCPYKVRRFNYFNYNKDVGVGYGVDAYPGSVENANRKLQALVLNPEVTVRGRGVMEKCTYCVQRVERAKIEARKDGGRRIVDGDIVMACQAACPSDAVVFGDISDPNSKVAKAKADIRTYGMLEQLNVKPRTTYMSRIRNTPFAMMTRSQITDLQTLEAPHHGHGDHGHDDHGHDSHGHDGHGHGGHSDGHGHDSHGHDDHGHGDHGHGDHGHDDHDSGDGKHPKSKTPGHASRRRFQLPIIG
ncbi:MAG: TAT-variant-translocated molybdopterin oxidoreductase [Planctomycetota bacterium]